MLLSDFDFELPEELIAQVPLADRAGARMMHLQRERRSMVDRRFRDFAGLLRDGDLLVLNNTRVIPARMLGRRSGSRAQPLSAKNPAMREFLTGRVEVLLTKRLSEWEWEALVKPGRKLGVGERVGFYAKEEKHRSFDSAQRTHLAQDDTSSDGTCNDDTSQDDTSNDDLNDAALLECEIVGRGEFGERVVRFDGVQDFERRLQEVGHVPLPPYIAREDTGMDRERYQTVFADPAKAGAAAAPTAGLHFTPEILEAVRARGIETAEVTLHVGLGTFQPLREPVVEANHLHRERYEITEAAAEKIARAQRERRRIVAVGTTSVRTLEFAAQQSSDGLVRAGSGEADIFIYPGYEFRVVGAMLTNFHLPQSSLLMLVAAFAGREFVLRAYEHAMVERYRFFSYGDCMFVESS